MTLPEFDVDYLKSKGFECETLVDGNMLCVLFKGFQLPPGLSIAQSDLLIRLSPGYPDVTPDMWWFSPGVFFQDGRNIPQTEVVEMYLGRQWQRWSRHFDSGRWRAGTDSIESFLAVLNGDLMKYAQQAA
jgi:Prokaryotic E2 family E